MIVVDRRSRVLPAPVRQAIRRRRWCLAFTITALCGLGMAIVFALHAHAVLAVAAAVVALVFGAAAYMTDNDAAEEQP